MVSHSPDYYPLSRHISDIDAIEAAFPHYSKLSSICQLLRLGIWTTEGVILAGSSDRAIAAALAFARSRRWAQFLLRHDSIQPKTIQGGFLVGSDELSPWVERFVQQGVCILLEPFNAIRNGYNISWLVDRSVSAVEIVGPGFDASDLQRGQTQPHEVRSVDFDIPSFGTPKFIGTDAYLHSVADRERKIWWKYYLRELDSDRWRDLSETEALACRRYKQSRGQLIPQRYRPIPTSTLHRCLKRVLPIVAAWRNNSAVIASSFVQTGELVYWDVSTHSRWTARLLRNKS